MKILRFRDGGHVIGLCCQREPTMQEYAGTKGQEFDADPVSFTQSLIG